MATRIPRVDGLPTDPWVGESQTLVLGSTNFDQRNFEDCRKKTWVLSFSRKN